MGLDVSGLTEFPEFPNSMRGKALERELMSQYISSGQKNLYNVRIQGHVSKVQNPGPFWEKRFLGPIFGEFPTFLLLRGQFFTILAPGLNLNFMTTLFYKKFHFDQLFQR